MPYKYLRWLTILSIYPGDLAVIRIVRAVPHERSHSGS